MKSVFLMYFSTAFKGVLTCLKRYYKRIFKVFLNSFKIYKKFQGFCKAKNRSKTVFKYLINRNKNRIKTVSETYFNLLYYFKTIFNGNFKRILKKKKQA